METEYKTPRAAFDWVLEIVALAALVGMLAWVAMHWSELPDRAPKHFNAAGEPDAWTGKRMLWLLPVIGVFHYLLLTTLSKLRLSKEDESPLLQGFRVRVLTWVKAMMLVSFAYITWKSVETALGQANGLGAGFIPAMVGITLIPPVMFWFRMRGARS